MGVSGLQHSCKGWEGAVGPIVQTHNRHPELCPHPMELPCPNTQHAVMMSYTSAMSPPKNSPWWRNPCACNSRKNRNAERKAKKKKGVGGKLREDGVCLMFSAPHSGSSALGPGLIPGCLMKVTQTESSKEEIWRILVRGLSMKAIPGWPS